MISNMVQDFTEVLAGSVIVLRIVTDFLSTCVFLFTQCSSWEISKTSLRTMMSTSIKVSRLVRTDFSKECVWLRVCVTVTSALFRMKSVPGYRTERRSGCVVKVILLALGSVFLKEVRTCRWERSAVILNIFCVEVSIQEVDHD